MSRKQPKEGLPATKAGNNLFRIACVCLSIMLFALANVNASSLSAQQRVSVSLSDVSIEQVIREVEKQSGYVVVYNNTQLESLSNVTVNSTNEPAQDVLNKVLKDHGMVCTLNDNFLVISTVARAAQPPQSISVAGRVTDGKGNPMVGATIVVKGTSHGVVTDANGNFTITVPSGPQTLTVSYIGMKTMEVSANQQQPLTIVLDEDSTAVEEVIVTGSFARAKESYTGAATKIVSRDLHMSSSRSVLSGIANIDPTFRLMESNVFGSDPNNINNVAITIRGGTSLADVQSDASAQIAANRPLFIIDMFEASMETVNDLNESRIQDITILKDASATALYGAKGSNGVVVITTKKPNEGKLRVTYKGTLSFEAPDLSSYNLMNANEKLDYEWAAGLYKGLGELNGQQMEDLYYARRLDAARGVNTYWLNYPTRLGVGNRHNVSLEGGEGSVRYSVNISNNSVKGAMKGSKRNTFNGDMFLSYTVNNLVFSNNLMLTKNKAYNSPYGSFEDYAKMNSYWIPYDNDGNPIKFLDQSIYYSLGFGGAGSSTESRKNSRNPLWNAELPARDDSGYTQIKNNFMAEWHIIPKELFLRGRFSVTMQDYRSDLYKSANHTDFDGYAGDDIQRKGTYRYRTGEIMNYEGEISGNYSKLFSDKHMFYAGMSFSIEQKSEEWYQFMAEGLSIPYIDFLASAGLYQKDGRPAGSEAVTRGLKGSALINYTYDHRYFADLALTLEGSSRFGSNNRAAPFWSAGAGWNLHHEDFMASQSIVNVARLRASYGVTGSVEFSPYQALRMYSLYGTTNYRGNFGMTLMGPGNPDLGWQKTGAYNLGVDLELFNNRLYLKADVYERITNDLVTDVSIPSSLGVSTYRANVGKVSNRGIESEARFTVINNRANGMHWTVGGTFLYNKNRILKISNALESLNEQIMDETGLTDDEKKIQRRNPSFLYKEGESIRTIFAVKSKGIDPSNGKEIFLKADGVTETYDWDARDMVACGVEDSPYWGTIYTNFRYAGFTLSAYFAYNMGGYAYNQTLINKVENAYPYMNVDRRAMTDRWKQPGDITYFKAIDDFTTTNASSRFVMKNNTFRMSSLSVRYDVPREWSKKKLGLEFISLTGSMEDLFHTSTIERDRGTLYPFSNKFSFSLEITF